MLQHAPTLDPAKFRDPRITAKGEPRAHVALQGLETLWFNTGTLCNLTCRNCYIESSPRNDRLAYLTQAEVRAYLDEIERDRLPVRTAGFTGGEPFLCPDLLPMLDDALSRGLEALVLTNAMRPMMKAADGLDALRARHGDRLRLRVSLDHYGPVQHEAERGPRTWEPTLDGLRWLAGRGFALDVAGSSLASPRPRSVPASPACSPSTPSRLTPPTRSASCCSPKWTRALTCRRSPRPAGASSASRRPTLCARRPAWSCGAAAPRARRSSPAPSCRTRPSSSWGRRSPRRPALSP